MRLFRIIWRLTKRFYIDLYREIRAEYFVVDIHSSGKYPANMLSNFAAHHFEIDGIECFSMEGFLQSLKTENIYYQRRMCQFVGPEARNRGLRAEKVRGWKESGILIWQGSEINRFSDEYQQLLVKAYDALFENKEFREALRASGKRKLIHSIGKNDPQQTILTVKEFCGLLNQLRKKL